MLSQLSWAVFIVEVIANVRDKMLAKRGVANMPLIPPCTVYTVQYCVCHTSIYI